MGSITRVVNLYKEEFDVYIGRENKRLGLTESIWHNPFHIGRDGSRKEVIEKYRERLFQSPYLLKKIKELKGKTLGCYCKPQPCHGDILAELADSGIPR